MDLSCIISSGDIELYVLGLLPKDEADKMEQLIALFPEIRQEADRISEALQVVANSSNLAPRASARENLFAELKQLNQTAAYESTDNVTAEQAKTHQSAKIIKMNSGRPSMLAAASIILLIASVAALVYYAGKTSSLNKEVVALRQKVDTVENDLNRATSTYVSLLEVLGNKDYRDVNLTATPGKPGSSLARVFWNKQTADVYILDVSLPATPPGKQYQLWAIVDGKPVNAGLLNNSKQGLQKMERFQKAEAFAITLEKAGGSAAPTMEEMYVFGKSS